MQNDDEPKHGFQGVWISAALWNNSELTWMERCLVAEIDSLSSAEYGPCHASCEFLAARMGSASPEAMRKMLSDLMKKGVIWQLGSDGRRTWRCVAPLYSNDQGKYQRWAQDSRYEQALTSGVTGRSHHRLPGAHTEIPVEIPVKDKTKNIYKKVVDETEMKRKQNQGQQFFSEVERAADAASEEDKRPAGMPPLSAITSQAATMGLPESDAQHIFNYWLGNGFKTGHHKVKDWRAVMRVWSSNKYFQSQKTVKYQPGDLMTVPILDALIANPAYKKIDVEKSAFEFKEWCEKNDRPKLVTSFIKFLNAKL